LPRFPITLRGGECPPRYATRLGVRRVAAFATGRPLASGKAYGGAGLPAAGKATPVASVLCDLSGEKCSSNVYCHQTRGPFMQAKPFIS